MKFYSLASFSGKRPSNAVSSYLFECDDADQFADTGHISVAQAQQRE